MHDKKLVALIKSRFHHMDKSLQVELIDFISEQEDWSNLDQVLFNLNREGA